MGEPPPFKLEHHFGEYKDMQEITILAELVIRCPGYHVCRSAVYQQDFVTDLALDHDCRTISIIKGQIVKGGRLPMITSSPDTQLIQHEGVDVQHFNKVIEACSGIGAVSTCLPFCGAKAACYVDYNQKFVEWLDRKEGAPVILGDIGDLSTVMKVAQVTQGRPLPLNGGIACQPFSALGGRREHTDPRSNSLPALLQMGYLLRSPIITLECTKEAFESHWVQSTLKEFTKQTGYVLHQTLLTLHHTWPAHRTRWWACLTMPMLGIQHIPDMPQMEFCPSIMHLMQVHPQLNPEENCQLNLSAYELRHFHDQPQGISSSVINMAKAMPTATHSWGSQLGACHCGCRQKGFSQSRIECKGLYGVLVPLGTMVKAGQDWFHGMRHPHPKEVAIVNALDPRYLDNSDPFTLKFLLAGVGQMASPLQGAWIFSNLFFQMMKNGFPITVDPPRHVMANICRQLLVARDITWPHVMPTRSTVLFERELNRLDHPMTSLAQEDVDPFVHAKLMQTQGLEAQSTVGDESREEAAHNAFLPKHVDVPIEHTSLSQYEHDMPSSGELLDALEPIIIHEDPPVTPPFYVEQLMKRDVAQEHQEEETPCIPQEKHAHTNRSPQEMNHQREQAQAGSEDAIMKISFKAGISTCKAGTEVLHGNEASEAGFAVHHSNGLPKTDFRGSFASVASNCHMQHAKTPSNHGIQDPSSKDRSDSLKESHVTEQPFMMHEAGSVSAPHTKVTEAGFAGFTHVAAEHVPSNTGIHAPCHKDAAEAGNTAPVVYSKDGSHDTAHHIISHHSKNEASEAGQLTLAQHNPLEAGQHALARSSPSEAGVPHSLHSAASEAGFSDMNHDLIAKNSGQSEAGQLALAQLNPPEAGQHALARGSPSEVGVPCSVHSAASEAGSDVNHGLIIKDTGHATSKPMQPDGQPEAPVIGLPSQTSKSKVMVGMSGSPTANTIDSQASSVPGVVQITQPSSALYIDVPSIAAVDGPKAITHHANSVRAKPDASEAGKLGHATPSPSEAGVPHGVHRTASEAETSEVNHDLTTKKASPVASPDMLVAQSKTAEESSSRRLQQCGICINNPPIAKTNVDQGGILPGTVRSAHAMVFAQSKEAKGILTPVQECMTTKVDPLMLNDPWKAGGTTLSTSNQHVTKINQSTAQQEAYSKNGGLQQFANRKRMAETGVETTAKRQAMNGPAAHETAHAMSSDEEKAKHDSASVAKDESQQIRLTNKAWVGHSGQPLHQVTFHTGATVGQLATAESRLTDLPIPVKTTTAVGSHLPVYKQVQPQQIILLEDGREDRGRQCPDLRGYTRLDALWQQKGWVAQDEMRFYLEMLGQPNLTNTTPPLIMTDDEEESLTIDRWIASVIEQAQQETAKITVHTACLHDKHWFPITIQIAGDDIHLTTTHHALSKVQKWATEALGDVFHFHYKVAREAFPADCGFQALAWIMAQELGDAQAYPMPAEEAVRWKELFANHLVAHQIAHLPASDLQLGGMIEPHVAELSNLPCSNMESGQIVHMDWPITFVRS